MSSTDRAGTFPLMGKSGVAQSQDCSSQTPVSAHYLVPENTSDLESGSVDSCSVTLQLCDLGASHFPPLGLSILEKAGPRKFHHLLNPAFPRL